MSHALNLLDNWKYRQLLVFYKIHTYYIMGESRICPKVGAGMMINRRISFMFLIAVILIGVFSLIGLPFGQFNLTTVLADYTTSESELCGGSNPTEQIRFFSNVTIYADAGLTNAIKTLTATSLYPQKFLVCPGTATAKSVRVVFANSTVYVPIPGNQVGRYARDSQ